MTTRMRAADPSPDETGSAPVRAPGRLQRPADFTGAPLTTFRAVFLRHGLPGLLLAVACLAHPDLRAILPGLLAGPLAHPAGYVLATVLLFAVLTAGVARADRRLDAGQAGWCLYLLLLSAWEEWLFRVAVPWLLVDHGVVQLHAVLASNLLFGLAHGFTLRWRWPWCIAAGLGGLALSRSLGVHGELAVLVGLHWVGTFVNTPRPPGRGGGRR